MNLTLTRTEYDSFGIFGRLTDENGNILAVTLEHGYDIGNGDGSYGPKVADGVYTCLRHAPNRLPYVTFELQNVPDFQGNPVTGILIHIGNYNHDSDGCILVGHGIVSDPDRPGTNMITSSAITYNKLMAMLDGLDSFTLTIRG